MFCRLLTPSHIPSKDCLHIRQVWFKRAPLAWIWGVFPPKTSTPEQNLCVSHKDAFTPPIAGLLVVRFLRNATVKPYLPSIQTLHLVKECLTYQNTLICTDLPSRAPTVSFCHSLFSQTHFLSTLTTTVLSALTSRLGHLNPMNGAAVLLQFCVRLGSNYFN